MTFNIVDSAQGARVASRIIAQLNSTDKDYLLGQIANAIDTHCDDIDLLMLVLLQLCTNCRHLSCTWISAAESWRGKQTEYRRLSS